MNDPQKSFRNRYPELDPAIRHIQRNPQMWLAVVLFSIGSVATALKISTLAGALFGAGAALLGAWITELNNRRSAVEEKSRRQSEARRYLAPELHRTIDRALYIHGRAIPNFTCASAESEVKPNDLKEDFLPYWPVLYPNAPQFRELSGDDAAALIAFYDSLHSLAGAVNDWWERDGQLPVNIFLSILHRADESLKFALVCVEKLELETLFPPPYESWGTISSRIERSISIAEEARKHHIARFEAKAAANKIQPLPQKPRRA
jgi:hypothetical protein